MTHRTFQHITDRAARATKHGVQFIVLVLVLIAQVRSTSAEVVAGPHYRHTDPLESLPAETPQGIVLLLADKDFAPYSFTAADGSVQGLTVDLAREACAELRLACEVVPMTFADLLPALQHGDGDVIVSGIAITPKGFDKLTPTRPVLVSTAAFYRHKSTALQATDIHTLAGKRIGYVRGSAHGAFLEKYYSRSSLEPYVTAEAMFQALSAKQLDAVFADSLVGSFWLRGTAAAGCCERLGRPYMDRSTFSRGLSFVVRDERTNLREAMDYALDQLEEKGTTAKVFARYLPDPLW